MIPKWIVLVLSKLLWFLLSGAGFGFKVWDAIKCKLRREEHKLWDYRFFFFFLFEADLNLISFLRLSQNIHFVQSFKAPRVVFYEEYLEMDLIAFLQVLDVLSHSIPTALTYTQSLQENIQILQMSATGFNRSVFSVYNTHDWLLRKRKIKKFQIEYEKIKKWKFLSFIFILRNYLCIISFRNIHHVLQ